MSGPCFRPAAIRAGTGARRMCKRVHSPAPRPISRLIHQEVFYACDVAVVSVLGVARTDEWIAAEWAVIPPLTSVSVRERPFLSAGRLPAGDHRPRTDRKYVYDSTTSQKR